MPDQPLKIVRVDSGEPASKPPLQLASLPWVGPESASVEAESLAAFGVEDTLVVPPPTPEPAPKQWVAPPETDVVPETEGDPAIAGRTYRRVDPPEQMSLASERERREAEESRRHNAHRLRAHDDQNANAGLSVALIIAAAVGMVCWMAYGPGQTSPELLPGDPLLLGSSDLPALNEPEDSATSEAPEFEPILKAPDSPETSIETEPLSAPASPTASEAQVQDAVAEQSPTREEEPAAELPAEEAAPAEALAEGESQEPESQAEQLVADLIPPNVAAPPLERTTEAPVVASAVVAEASGEKASNAGGLIKTASVEVPAEPQTAGYARTAHRDIDNRAIDFRRFSPTAAPRQQARPAKQLGPLFQP